MVLLRLFVAACLIILLLCPNFVQSQDFEFGSNERLDRLTKEDFTNLNPADESNDGQINRSRSSSQTSESDRSRELNERRIAMAKKQQDIATVIAENRRRNEESLKKAKDRLQQVQNRHQQFNSREEISKFLNSKFDPQPLSHDKVEESPVTSQDQHVVKTQVYQNNANASVEGDIVEPSAVEAHHIDDEPVDSTSSEQHDSIQDTDFVFDVVSGETARELNQDGGQLVFETVDDDRERDILIDELASLTDTSDVSIESHDIAMDQESRYEDSTDSDPTSMIVEEVEIISSEQHGSLVATDFVAEVFSDAIVRELDQADIQHVINESVDEDQEIDTMNDDTSYSLDSNNAENESYDIGQDNVKSLRDAYDMDPTSLVVEETEQEVQSNNQLEINHIESLEDSIEDVTSTYQYAGEKIPYESSTPPHDELEVDHASPTYSNDISIESHDINMKQESRYDDSLDRYPTVIVDKEAEVALDLSNDASEFHQIENLDYSADDINEVEDVQSIDQYAIEDKAPREPPTPSQNTAYDHGIEVTTIEPDESQLEIEQSMSEVIYDTSTVKEEDDIQPIRKHGNNFFSNLKSKFTRKFRKPESDSEESTLDPASSLSLQFDELEDL